MSFIDIKVPNTFTADTQRHPCYRQPILFHWNRVVTPLKIPMPTLKPQKAQLSTSQRKDERARNPTAMEPIVKKDSEEMSDADDFASQASSNNGETSSLSRKRSRNINQNGNGDTGRITFAKSATQKIGSSITKLKSKKRLNPWKNEA